MELLFATLGGAILGVIAHYALPGRVTNGSLLVPAIGAAVASVVWAALTWARWPFDGGWIWVVTLVAAGIASGLASLVLGRHRRFADAALLDSLTRSPQRTA